MFFYVLYAYVSCMNRMILVSVIHSEVRCSRSGFRFVKNIILRNRSYVNMALNSRERRMSEKIKMVVVQYLLMHLSVEAICFKLKHFQLYDQQTSPELLIKKWRSGKGLRKTRNNNILYCNIQRCETWPRTSILDTWLTVHVSGAHFSLINHRGVYPQLTLYGFI